MQNQRTRRTEGRSSPLAGDTDIAHVRVTAGRSHAAAVMGMSCRAAQPRLEEPPISMCRT
jgi:hypothetical protein